MIWPTRSATSYGQSLAFRTYFGRPSGAQSKIRQPARSSRQRGTSETTGRCRTETASQLEPLRLGRANPDECFPHFVSRPRTIASATWRSSRPGCARSAARLRFRPGGGVLSGPSSFCPETIGWRVIGPGAWLVPSRETSSGSHCHFGLRPARLAGSGGHRAAAAYRDASSTTSHVTVFEWGRWQTACSTLTRSSARWKAALSRERFATAGSLSMQNDLKLS
jgi:hypothetical protein